MQAGNGDGPAVPYPTEKPPPRGVGFSDMSWEDDGPVGVLRDQDAEPDPAGGSKPAASAASVVANHTSATVRP